MADATELAARVDELEARLTLQQDDLDKLSEVLWRQQRELDRLAAQVKSLEARRAGGGEAEVAPQNDPPPHY